MFKKRVFAPGAPAPAPPSREPAVAPAPDVERLPALSEGLLIAFAVAHLPLGLWMHAQSAITFVHGAITFAAGMWWALSSNRLERVAWTGAYIVGAEVLWRMTTDALPWESGKAMIIVIFSVAILNTQGLKGLLMPGLFFALLLPSAILTIKASEYAVWRGQLSFNLTGPLALVLAARLFSHVYFTPAALMRLFMALIAPTLAIVAIVTMQIVTAQNIEFTTESNFATSGGFGPNQVSLALGLGALAALWLLLDEAARWPLRLLMFAAMAWLITQCALTFSRGGFIGATTSALVAMLFLLGERRVRKRISLVLFVTVPLGMFVVWPSLIAFTGGTIAARYEETNLTSRDKYIYEDIEAWSRNPILGVGPGLSAAQHTRSAATHTELSRLLSEHGSFGALFVLSLGLSLLLNVYAAPTAKGKAFAASAMLWSLLYMTNAAMRTVAPALMFGLGFSHLGQPAGEPAGAADAASGRPTRRRFGTLTTARPSTAR